LDLISKIKGAFRNNMRQYAMLIALIVIVAFFQVLTDGILLMPRNVTRLILQNSHILILAIGMVLCILTGGNIDLSVGSVVALVSAMSAFLSVNLGLPVPIAIIFGLLCGLLAGMWQGFWIAYIKIPAFIVTLGGMLVFRGINNLILDGQTIGLPQDYVTLASGMIPDFIGGNGVLHITTIVIGVACSVIYIILSVISRLNKVKQGFDVMDKRAFILKIAAIVALINLATYWLAMDDGLPNVFILVAVLIAAYTFLTTRTIAGRHIYALGGNAKAAELSGVNTKKVLFWVYANMGLLSALAGIIFAGRLNSASPTAGVGFELDAIAASFIGGASASGGIGTVLGAVIGAVIMGVLNNGMSIMGVSTFWQNIIKGLVLLAAVAFDVYSKSKAKKIA